MTDFSPLDFVIQRQSCTASASLTDLAGNSIDCAAGGLETTCRFAAIKR